MDLGTLTFALSEQCEAYLHIYIMYNSVSIPAPWAVSGPYWQLASIRISLSQHIQPAIILKKLDKFFFVWESGHKCPKNFPLKGNSTALFSLTCGE